MRRSIRSCRSCWLVFGLLVVGPSVVEGQRPPIDDRSVFRSGIELVYVTATVVDANGRLVDGLTQDDFEIYEDRDLQPVTYFSTERVPLSLGLVLDIIDSMYGTRIDDARAALDRFLLDLLEPTDEAFLLVFNHEPTLTAEWALRPSRLSPYLDDVRPYGGTAMYDAMLEALPLFRGRRHQRAAIVLVSDGADTASDHPVREVRQRLRSSDAFVYAIAIDAKESMPINDRVNLQALREMTDESGGYTELVLDTADLAPAARRIADELNQQYTLGYSPSKAPDGRYRRIRVRIADRDHRVRARQGYVATPRDPRGPR